MLLSPGPRKATHPISTFGCVGARNLVPSAETRDLPAKAATRSAPVRNSLAAASHILYSLTASGTEGAHVEGTPSGNTRVPTGQLSGTSNSSTIFLSGFFAHNTMPLDVTPLNFAGIMLHTASNFLPW